MIRVLCRKTLSEPIEYFSDKWPSEIEVFSAQARVSRSVNGKIFQATVVDFRGNKTEVLESTDGVWPVNSHGYVYTLPRTNLFAIDDGKKRYVTAAMDLLQKDFSLSPQLPYGPLRVSTLSYDPDYTSESKISRDGRWVLPKLRFEPKKGLYFFCTCGASLATCQVFHCPLSDKRKDTLRYRIKDSFSDHVRQTWDVKNLCYREGIPFTR